MEFCSMRKYGKYNNQYVATVVVDVLSVCMVSWHENIFRIAGPFWWESTGHQIFLTTRNAKLEYFFVVSLGKVLNWTQESRCRWFTGDVRLLLWVRIGFYSYSRYHENVTSVEKYNQIIGHSQIFSHTVDNAIRYGVQCLRGCLILITI